MEINYKNKYQALRLKFMESVDMAFRLGYEQGMKDAQMEAMAAAQEPDPNDPNAQGEEGEEGQEGQEEGGEGEAQPGEEAQVEEAPAPGAPGTPAGSELDQHISQLESLVGNKEAKPEDMEKALNVFKSFRAKVAFEQEMRKSEKAIKAIGKALNPKQKAAKALNKLKISKVASHNLGANAKQALSLQHKIVDDVMKSWEEAEKAAKSKLSNVLAVENLSKKE